MSSGLRRFCAPAICVGVFMPFGRAQVDPVEIAVEIPMPTRLSVLRTEGRLSISYDPLPRRK